jgi:hypothetical protein
MAKDREIPTAELVRPALLARVFMVFGCGGIFLFFSEYVFVNEGAVRDLVALGRGGSFSDLVAVAEMFLTYGFFAYGFLIVLGYFRASTIWSLFLAAAILGWIIEGVVIGVVYEAIPLSFAWTAIGWHAIIDVLIGFVLVRKVLGLNRLALTAAMATGIGLFWGVFATWTRGTPGEDITVFSGTDFTVFAFAAAVIWIGSTMLVCKLGGTEFRASRMERVVVFGVMAALAALMASTALPWSLLLLPIVLLTLYALKRARPATPHAWSPFAMGFYDGTKVRWANFAMLGLAPVAASLSYPVYLAAGFGLNAELVAIPLVFGGTAMFAVSLFKVLRSGKAPRRAAPGAA